MSKSEKFDPKKSAIEIEKLNVLFDNGDLQTVIEIGEPMLKLIDSDYKIGLIQLIALSHFHLSEHDLALPYFEEVAADSNSCMDWFNVSTTAIMAKHVDEGLDAFSRAVDLYQQDDLLNVYTVGQMTFFVMQALRDIKAYDLAFEQLVKLRDVYCELKITDDGFLHMRGLPFLGQVLEASKITIKNQSKVDAQVWLQKFASQLDEDGKLMIGKVAAELNRN